ncbi:restriction endonuclease subunit S [Rheinheimera sp. A13L]|uniref:restriction endonuclease subunit S n=1 Tax=Rheinheimera sp. A13L TaxID=506534 RepID=UPI001300D750|nr:restriction endonuclease subunit S [Rheinheimera sp. A13L]
MKKVSELFSTFKIGGTPSRGNPSYFDGPNLWVSIRDMEGQSIITKTAETISAEGVRNSNCKLVKKGSLLFSFKLTVGRISFAGVDLYTNEAIAAFDPDEAKAAGIDLEYLSLVLPIAASTDTTKNSMGAALLNKDKILNLEIPYFELPQQRQIAARLKAQLAEVETARQAVQEQMRDASALKKRALESLFSSLQSWSPICSAAKLQSGYAFKSDTFKTSGVRLLRNANILPGKVYWDDSVFLSEIDAAKFSNFALDSDDVLISLDRPLISSGIKVARVSNDDLPALLVQRVGRFIVDPDKLDKDYLYAFLQTDLFISNISGHDQSLGVPHISPSQVEAIELPLPGLDEQKVLTKRLKEITDTWQNLVSALQKQINDLTILPKAILAQAFKNES